MTVEACVLIDCWLHGVYDSKWQMLVPEDRRGGLFVSRVRGLTLRWRAEE